MNKFLQRLLHPYTVRNDNLVDLFNFLLDNNLMNWKVWGSAILGIIFLVIAFVYFTNQAQNLPAFFPGHQAGLTKIHTTHAIASFVVALLFFAFAWFNSGKKKKSEPSTE